MPFLLDRISVVEQLAILPHEIIHLIECETLDERSGVAVPSELLLLGDVRDAGTANEAGAGNETVADAARRITRAVRPASAAQRRVPQRSIRRQIRRGGMRATRRGLRLQTPDVGEDEPRVEIGDTTLSVYVRPMRDAGPSPRCSRRMLNTG